MGKRSVLVSLMLAWVMGTSSAWAEDGLHEAAPARAPLFEPPPRPNPLTVDGLRTFGEALASPDVSPFIKMQIADGLADIALNDPQAVQAFLVELPQRFEGALIPATNDLIRELLANALAKSLDPKYLVQSQHLLSLLDEWSLKVGNIDGIRDSLILIQEVRERLKTGQHQNNISAAIGLLAKGRPLRAFGNLAVGIPKEVLGDIGDFVQDPGAMNALVNTLQRLNQVANQSPSKPGVRAALEIVRMLPEFGALSLEERRARFAAALPRILPILLEEGLPSADYEKILKASLQVQGWTKMLPKKAPELEIMQGSLSSPFARGTTPRRFFR